MQAHNQVQTSEYPVQPSAATQESKDAKSNKRKVESYDISKSDETLHLAADLARFIKENKLYVNLQGKEYVNVEGWQYAGSRLGILPIVEELTNLSDETEIKYQSRVRLLNLRNEQVVGSGFAICSNKEPGKKFFQEYAVASMAQTRAIGKAYRNILAWLIRAAGYEPTPAEEMESVTHPLGNHISNGKQETVTTKPVEALSKPIVAPEPAVQPAATLATTRQKAEILLLLNSEVITKEEKEKMIGGINKLDKERADKVIEKLKLTIAQRRAENPLEPIEQVA